MAKPLVYIFFNGDTGAFEPRNDWEKFPPNYQEIRLFNVAAESWERNGFEVRRLTTFGVPKEKRIAYSPSGNGPGHNRWYPEEFWQLIPAVEAVLDDCVDLPIFTSLDVINRCYGVGHYFANVASLTGTRTFVNFQSEHFSLGTFICRSHFCREMRALLADYDSGRVKPLELPYVSDETIARELWQHKHNTFHSMTQSFHTQNLLVHFARSTLKEKFNSYSHA